jgi:hypothetical protein
MPFIKSADAQIHYALDGQSSKPPLILSNALGADFSMWDPKSPNSQSLFASCAQTRAATANPP